MTIHFATEPAGINSANKICQAVTKIVTAAGGSATLNPSGAYINGTISFNGVDHKIESKISGMNGDIVGAWDDSHTLVLYSGSRTPVDTFTNRNNTTVNYYVFAIFVGGTMWWMPDNKLIDGVFNIGEVTVKPASSTMRAMLTPLVVGGEDMTPVFISQNGVVDTAGTTVTDTAGNTFVSLGNLLYIRESAPADTKGTAVTCQVGNVTTLPAGSAATVSNAGTLNDVILDFGIPAGPQGPKGDTGAQGKTDSVGNSTILCIGDSFGDKKAKDHGAWTTELAALIPNANLVVQCESGTGFWRAYGTNFKTQIAKAKAAGVNPDIVVIAGGVNDTNAPLDELQTSVTNTFTEAWNDFPNAQIVLIPMMAGYYHLTLQRRKVAHVIMSVAAQMGIPFARYMWWWNQGNRDNVVSDNLHPTQKGANLLAHVILAFLQGREILPTTKVTEVVWNNGTLRRYILGGRVHIHFMCNNVEDASTFEKVLALPEIVTSTAQTKIFSGYSDSGTKPLFGYFELADNVENITFHITSTVGTGQCLFDIEYDV